MSTNRLCSFDKDLEKYIKFLAQKISQVVVQSRLGEKIQTQCDAYSGYDWFNIVIQDHPDVLTETKRALNLNTGDSILQRLPLCVEISLQTVEGDKMILEVWSLSLHPEQNDPTLRAPHLIYNRMGILLKSLISVTRATPAYKLSRRQSPETYSIYYRIYVDEPQIHNLGEGYKQVRVGQLSTTVGALNMSVAYRTKMTISPTQTGRDNTIMLKSDHFLKDLSPKNIRYHHIKKSEKKIIDMDKPLRPGAFVDTSKIKQFTEDDFILPEIPPFNWLIRKTKEEVSQDTSVEGEKNLSNLNSPEDKNAHASPETIATTTDESMKTNSSNNNNNNNINFKSFENSDVKQSNQKTGMSPIRSLLVPAPEELKKPLKTSLSIPDDENLLKELHFPFASANTEAGDLAKFCRDVFCAPKLDLQLIRPPSRPASLENLSKQLDQFETSLDDYESLVKSMDCSTLDSNSNS